MIDLLKTRRILVTFGLISAVAVAWIVLSFIRNPMDARLAKLEAEINDIQVAPVFVVGPSQTNYPQVQRSIQGKNVLWRALISPHQQAKPQATGPNFAHLLKGVDVSGPEMKVGDTLKLRVVTPQSPRGNWVQVGDKLGGTEIVQITPQSVIVSATKGNKTYKHTLQRK